MNNSEPLIQAIDLYKVYSDSDVETIAVRGFSLDIYDNDKIVLIGPSGSGKTTIVSMLTGHIKPTAGQIFWKVSPKEINQLDDNKRIKLRRTFMGLIDQETSLFPQLSVRENIIISSKIAELEFDEISDQYYKLLDILDLEKLLDRKPGVLSRGEVKRVNIANALITNPEFLIADEPVGDLDPVTANNILDLFDVIHSELGTAFVLTSHDQAVAERGNRIIEISEGHLSGLHNNQVQLNKLEKSRRIIVDKYNRISLPPEFLDFLNNPKVLKLSINQNSIKLTPDIEAEKLYETQRLRECPNCNTKSTSEFCQNCGYPTIEFY